MEAVSASSRVALRNLRALEEDRHDGLPAPVYVRGFIRAYCAEVDTPVDAALALYDARAPADRGAPLCPPPVTRPAVAGAPRPARRLLVLGAIGGGLVIIGVMTLVVGRLRPFERTMGRPPRPAPPAGSLPAAATPAPAPAMPPAVDRAAEPEGPPPAPPPAASAPARRWPGVGATAATGGRVA